MYSIALFIEYLQQQHSFEPQKQSNSTANMNLDFILFSAPKTKYQIIDFLGQTIFIPSFTPVPVRPPQPPHSKPEQKGSNILKSLTNCYRANKATEVYFSIQNALSQQMGQPVKIENEDPVNNCATTNVSSQNENQEQQISHYVPCLYLNSMVGSKYLVLYFHASGEDIRNGYGLLNYIRNSYQVNVIAMEYPGYSIYKGSASSKQINDNARTVYQYVTKELGFQERNIIVMGRSIGTGVALQLLKKRKKDMKTPNPRCLVLISPFASVKNLVQEFVGRLGTIFTKETYDNIENMGEVKCPVFIVHGKKDSLIPVDHSKQLIKNCYTRKKLITPENMTHSAFDYYSDLVDPLREYLIEQGINFYEQNMKGPTVPEEMFKWPEGYNV